MTRDLLQRAAEVFGELRDCAPAARPARLERLCGADLELRREVESLLEHELPSRTFKAPVSLLSPEPSVPERVGPYRILKKLGHGGMGTVYLAQQEEPVRRRVALKLLQVGFGLDEILRRFQTERHILANLHHPNIATFFDAGTTDDGRQPYFAMEHVEGETIEEYCDQKRLPVCDRLRLFCQVCSAVELAHRNLVIHRDIKPDNILVDASGTPKLLDFGIAKLLQIESGVHTVLTTRGSHGPMTVPYASPEMVAGGSVTTACDVYALGILLYRLLAGRHPYAVRGLKFDEIVRVIRQEKPRRPSVVVGLEASPGDHGAGEPLTPQAVAEDRSTEPAKLKLHLAGDLDAIVLKALRKEPKDRYGSVAELSQDVRRHLDALPVLARAGDRWYPARKYVQRHRWKLTVAASTLLLLVGFAIAVTGLYRQTLDERNQARISRDLFVEILQNTNLRNAEESLTPDQVVKRGVDRYDKSFEKAFEIQANVFDSLGLVYYSRGFFQNARPLLEEAERIRRETLGENHWLTAGSQNNLALLLQAEGQYELAAEYSRRAQATLRAYPQLRRELARAIDTYATQLYHLRDFDRAGRLYQESLDIKVKEHGRFHLEVATSLANVGSFWEEMGDLELAKWFFEESGYIRKALLPENHPKLALAYSHMGAVLRAQKRFDLAVPLYRDVLEIRTNTLAPEHPSTALAHYLLAFCLHRSGDYGEAERHYRAALKVRCREGSQDTESCLVVKKSLALLFLAQGELTAAAETATHVLRVFRRTQPEGHWRIADAKSVVGACLAAQGRYHDAEVLLLESYPLILQEKGPDSLVTQDAKQRLCDLYQTWRKPAKAAEHCDSAS